MTVFFDAPHAADPTRRPIRRRFFALALALVFLAFCSAGCGRTKPQEGRFAENTASPPPQTLPSRIVSMSPSVTETLFALGLGPRVVAVSDYCRYPKEVERLPKVGGLYNPNIERIAELRPDLVVVLNEHVELAERLERFGIETLSVDHATVSGILDSFGVIGRRFGGATLQCAQETADAIQSRLETLRRRTAPLPKRRVLLSIDRERGVPISQVYVAGNNPYFNELLEIAGGTNVFAGSLAAVPTVSVEALFEKNPEVIFDFTADWENSGNALTETVRQSYLRDWGSLGERVDAVRTGRIYPILDDFATVPGPRLTRLAEKLAGLLHPELSETEDKSDDNLEIKPAASGNEPVDGQAALPTVQ